MKKTLFITMIILILSSIAFSACSKASDEDAKVSELESQVKDLNDMITDLNEQLDISGINSDSVLIKSLAAVRMIAEKDMQGLSGYIHPVKGARFSPYAYIDTETSLLFTADEISSLMTSSEIYTWGSFDGTGDPIEMTFDEYYDRFIYDQDFASPDIVGNNKAIGTGNTPNNIADVFPDGRFVEFHFAGFDPKYEGMDWRSLRIVFEFYEGKWYVVAIIHAEWTI